MGVIFFIFSPISLHQYLFLSFGLKNKSKNSFILNIFLTSTIIVTQVLHILGCKIDFTLHTNGHVNDIDHLANIKNPQLLSDNSK
jgi:hypothetical protein